MITIYNSAVMEKSVKKMKLRNNANVIAVRTTIVLRALNTAYVTSPSEINIRWKIIKMQSRY